MAELPLEDVALTVTAPDGSALAMRLTDSSGKINRIEVDVPPASESQSPNPDQRPYTVVNLFARKENYEQINVYSVQIFAGVTTEQNLKFIPLPEFPEAWDRAEDFDTPPQNL